MSAASKSERVAILLRSLDRDFSEGILSQVPTARSEGLKKTLASFEASPPDDDLVTEVLEEFIRFADFALANAKDLFASQGVASAEVEAYENFVSTGDPFADLETLKNYQIAGALRKETGATAAIILGQLPDDRVGAILGQLPDEVRQTAFLRLQSSSKIAKPVIAKMVRRVVDTASTLDPSAASDPAHVAIEKTASLLRSMDRSTRTSMLQTLEDNSPDIAEQVKQMLFVFDDLALLTDKSIQKLLGEVDTSELATTLKNAEEDIQERVFANLSKRAKLSLREEIEFLDSVSADREEEAQAAICAILAKLDQAGDLEMIS